MQPLELHLEPEQTGLGLEMAIGKQAHPHHYFLHLPFFLAAAAFLFVFVLLFAEHPTFGKRRV